MEDAFAVQVLQPTGNIKRQTDPDAPRQVEVAVQQLLQIPTVDVLQTDRERIACVFPSLTSLQDQRMGGCLCRGLTSVRAWS